MENESNLPFKVGQLAEARSFQKGFRGAWFRCKIRDISVRRGHISHLLEYYDFPDEKLKWTKLYQLPGHSVGKGKEKHRELILRPAYPPFYNERQMSDVNVNSEVAVIVCNSWKVGNLVDWWTTSCYWSGKIIELFDDNKSKIQLEPPPFGEGSVDDILLKDVRPSLDWSPELGWTLPSQEDNTGHTCARLIKPRNQVTRGLPLQPMDTDSACQGAEADQGTAGSSVGLSVSSPASYSSLLVSDEAMSVETTDTHKQSSGPTVSKETKDMSTIPGFGGKINFPDTDSGQTPTEPPSEVAAEDDNLSDPPRECRVSKRATLHSSRSDTAEAAVLDLEEYLNKVKWLRRILDHGISSPDVLLPQWKFLEPGASSENPKEMS